ncbi:MAG: hypothetical protein A2295_02305 [Candidatus Jacksonbacteria bacterium RIFOXYB2_FULL_44_15]|nr:MAG: hypothetical protein A2295_02305 [Candidatus Jacksonbacteria bacterium RIFOXYB2_FULL_44_15]OGY76832.1 MAG: hypothetical protein A2240_04640 [Candidatus Jacksonbacteria bacterium RIFOXYA2_FULL_43_12]OGY82191.1 MAG: hypothetical protein A2550_05810 [Candidatus Jacksonbacteria bacterium RIFOXYD2_FULL_43_21]
MQLIKKLLKPFWFGIIIYHKGLHDREKKIDYQQRFFDFKIKAGEQVLDIGSGGDPFAYATHLVDKYPQDTHHRHNKLKTRDLPFTQADVENLPFADKSFDFVYSAHVLEHVDNPGQACDEIMRVGKRGYVETPTRTSDLLFNFIKIPDFHRWHISLVNQTLIFLEYTAVEKVDTKRNEFLYMVHSWINNPLKKIYDRSKNLFNNMFFWEENFFYYVFDKNGHLVSTNKTS